MMFFVYKKEVLKSCLFKLLFICLSASITFAYSGGSGDSNSPYQIGSVSDWQQLMTSSADWNKNFILIADVNLHGVTLTPVGDYNGSSGTNFTGVFDGNDHIIRNARINSPTIDYIGLFGYIGTGGQVHNLGIEDVNITGRIYVGGLVGWNNSGAITNCYVMGTITGLPYSGGLAGYNQGTITNCYTTGTVTVGSNQVFAGGLVGYNIGTITNCHTTSTVTGYMNVGG